LTAAFLLGTFWHDFAVNVAGGIVAGGVVLGLGYYVIDRRFHVQDRLDARRQRELDEADRREQADAYVAQRRAAALEALSDEIRTNAAGLQANHEALTKRRVMYSLFSRSALDLAFQSSIYVTLPPAVARAMGAITDRMRTATEQHELVFDLTQGRTAFLAAPSVRPNDPTSAEIYRAFQQQREVLRGALRQRREELAPHLYDAVDAIERELGRHEGVPASRRSFQLGDVGYMAFPHDVPNP
jgi:hypothetical protein